MATVITHALVAGAISVFSPQKFTSHGSTIIKVPRLRLIFCLILLAVIPDLDSIGFRYGIPYSDVFGHRGFTHSLLFSVVTAFCFGLIIFRSMGVGTKIWWYIVFLLSVAGISHGILDAFTDAGLGVGFLIPMDNDRYFFPWRPLETSPVSISAFFNGPAKKILLNEMLWVWLPVFMIIVLVGIFRAAVQRLADKRSADIVE